VPVLVMDAPNPRPDIAGNSWLPSNWAESNGAVVTRG
jgi:hypothetical protein